MRRHPRAAFESHVSHNPPHTRLTSHTQAVHSCTRSLIQVRRETCVRRENQFFFKLHHWRRLVVSFGLPFL